MYKVAKHFILDISDHHLDWRRDQAAIDAEAALDGIYIIRTPVPSSQLDAPRCRRRRLQEPGLRRTRLPHPQSR
jgi:hypothetical protein